MSAVSGAIGAGGLGQLALVWGYNRYNDVVTWVAVGVMVLLVQAAQGLGNVLARRLTHR